MSRQCFYFSFQGNYFSTFSLTPQLCHLFDILKISVTLIKKILSPFAVSPSLMSSTIATPYEAIKRRSTADINNVHSMVKLE
jgi:hypothetical protein